MSLLKCLLYESVLKGLLSNSSVCDLKLNNHSPIICLYRHTLLTFNSKNRFWKVVAHYCNNLTFFQNCCHSYNVLKMFIRTRTPLRFWQGSNLLVTDQYSPPKWKMYLQERITWILVYPTKHINDEGNFSTTCTCTWMSAHWNLTVYMKVRLKVNPSLRQVFSHLLQLLQWLFHFSIS